VRRKHSHAQKTFPIEQERHEPEACVETVLRGLHYGHRDDIVKRASASE
jgi:hypothetical protein